MPVRKEIQSRLCSKCDKQPARSAGQRYCKQCHAEYMRSWRPAYSEMTEEQKKKDCARSYASVYKYRGKLIPKPCEKCGSEDNIEMHHEDYDRPLQVKWFCRDCHVEHHIEITLT